MELHVRRTRSSSSSSARKALSDLTNATKPLFSSSSSSSFKFKSKSKPKPSAAPEPALPSNLRSISVKSSSSVGSSGPENPRNWRIPTNRAPDQEFSKNFGAVTFDKSKYSAAHMRHSTEERKDKGKTIAAEVALGCPPLKKIRNIGGKLKVESRDVQLGASSAPCKRRRKKQQHTISSDESQEYVSSQDYIEKQRAYFAEIDAFDLAEEAVSESELE